MLVRDNYDQVLEDFIAQWVDTLSNKYIGRLIKIHYSTVTIKDLEIHEQCQRDIEYKNHYAVLGCVVIKLSDILKGWTSYPTGIRLVSESGNEYTPIYIEAL